MRTTSEAAAAFLKVFTDRMPTESDSDASKGRRELFQIQATTAGGEANFDFAIQQRSGFSAVTFPADGGLQFTVDGRIRLGTPQEDPVFCIDRKIPAHFFETESHWVDAEN